MDNAELAALIGTKTDFDTGFGLTTSIDGVAFFLWGIFDLRILESPGKWFMLL